MMRGIACSVVAVAVLLTAGCGGARHRKVAGPPPEYELPEDPDAGAALPAAASPPSRRTGGDGGWR